MFLWSIQKDSVLKENSFLFSPHWVILGNAQDHPCARPTCCTTALPLKENSIQITSVGCDDSFIIYSFGLWLYIYLVEDFSLIDPVPFLGSQHMPLWGLGHDSELIGQRLVFVSFCNAGIERRAKHISFSLDCPRRWTQRTYYIYTFSFSAIMFLWLGFLNCTVKHNKYNLQK